MSLVAYGSSDDSGGSDIEDDNTPVVAQNRASSITPDGASTAHNSGSVSVNADLISDSDSDTDVAMQTNDNTGGDILKGLPAPKSGHVIGETEVLIEETDVLEEEVKPKSSQVSDIAKPAPKKSRQPVKITIPALQDYDDNDEPVKKKVRCEPATGKSGLFSLLPAPVHAAKKEANRILLPYSLTRKSQSENKPKSENNSAAASSKSKDATLTDSKPKNFVTSLASYGSDSDDEEESSEPVNFFSLDSQVKSTSEQREVTNSIMKSTQIVEETFVGPSLPEMDTSVTTSVPVAASLPLGPRMGHLHLPAPTQSNSENQVITSANNVEYANSQNDRLDAITSSCKSYSPAVDADAPLMFKAGVSSEKHSVSSSGMVGPSLPSQLSEQHMYTNMPYTGGGQYPEVDSLQAFQQDNEFLRLQGKKQRGMEEINIIDVNADDYTDPSEIMKHLTEEETYQSHRKKDDQPSSQQKRKHQIVSLAFQAKERELELKNQWSQNRQTKKQTQAKYGF